MSHRTLSISNLVLTIFVLTSSILVINMSNEVPSSIILLGIVLIGCMVGIATNVLMLLRFLLSQKTNEVTTSYTYKSLPLGEYEALNFDRPEFNSNYQFIYFLTSEQDTVCLYVTNEKLPGPKFVKNRQLAEYRIAAIGDRDDLTSGKESEQCLDKNNEFESKPVG